MSVGVVIAATVIYIKPEWHLADPLCTFFFSIIICFTSFPVIADCIHVLMEGCPEDDVDVNKLFDDIMAQSSVEDVHDLHVWSVSVGKLAMTVHIKSSAPLKTLKSVTEMVRADHGILHTTIQVEGYGEHVHEFECDNDLHDQLS